MAHTPSARLLARLMLALPGALVLSVAQDSDHSIACLLKVPQGCYQVLQHADGRVELWSATGPLEEMLAEGLTRQAWMTQQEVALNRQAE